MARPRVPHAQLAARREQARADRGGGRAFACVRSHSRARATGGLGGSCCGARGAGGRLSPPAPPAAHSRLPPNPLPSARAPQECYQNAATLSGRCQQALKKGSVAEATYAATALGEPPAREKKQQAVARGGCRGLSCSRAMRVAAAVAAAGPCRRPLPARLVAPPAEAAARACGLAALLGQAWLDTPQEAAAARPSRSPPACRFPLPRYHLHSPPRADARRAGREVSARRSGCTGPETAPRPARPPRSPLEPPRPQALAAPRPLRPLRRAAGRAGAGAVAAERRAS